MDKKGNKEEFVHRVQRTIKLIKSSYLYKLISKVLSVICSIVLVILLVVGAFMFVFNMKAKSYERRGMEYTAPFGLYTIISGSMEPNVEVYDVVVAVDTDISDIKVGDIITFVSTWDVNFGYTVTHRVVEINKNENGEYQLSTKGDNNQSKDGSVVTQSNLVGKVVGRIPQLGQVQVFLATKLGWFFVVFIPALAIIIFDVIKIFKLRVLKDKIDNVKSTKEVVKNQNEEKPKLDEIISENIEPIHKVDETVDTVELPKVDLDGQIKDSTGELPKVEVEELENETVELPILKSSSDKPTIDTLDIQRRMLNRKK